MASSRYLLDTVIIIAYFNQEKAIRKRAKNITVYLSSVTVSELYFGAYNSQQISSNLQQIKEFVEAVTVLPCDETTGDHYGRVKQTLRVKGPPEAKKFTIQRRYWLRTMHQFIVPS